MKVLIVDDEPLARSYLRRLLEAQGVVVAGEADSAGLALQQAQDLHPDLIFLDIRMPGMTGLQMASALLALGNAPMLVFVTGYAEYGVEAFEHDAIDYLVKPVSAERLTRMLVRANERLADRRRREDAGPDQHNIQLIAADGTGTAERASIARLPVREDYSVRLLRIDDIICAAAREKRVFIRTSTEEHRTSYTLKQLEALLPPDRFFRVHDSYVVRIDMVKELHLLGSHSYAIRMEGGLMVPVGRSRYRELQHRLGLDVLPSS